VVFRASGSGVDATWEVRMGGCCHHALYSGNIGQSRRERDGRMSIDAGQAEGSVAQRPGMQVVSMAFGRQLYRATGQ